MEELRKERKLKMAIKDKGIDAYIKLSLEKIPDVKDQSPHLKQVLKEKWDHRG